MVGDITEAQLAALTAKTGASVLAQLGVTDKDVFFEVNNSVLQYAKNRGAEMVGKKWVDGKLVANPNAQWVITDSTREMINSRVQEALTEGLTPDKLADEIQSVLMGEGAEIFSESRAYNIAITEMNEANSMANQEAWRLSGVVKQKQWLTNAETTVCEQCQANADQGIIDIDEDFQSGDETTPAHPNCYCDVVAIVDEDAQFVDSSEG